MILYKHLCEYIVLTKNIYIFSGIASCINDLITIDGNKIDITLKND